MPNPTATVSPPAARSLSDICDAVRRVTCGHCWQIEGVRCVTHPVTGAVGFHAARFAMAFRCDLISGTELVAALAIPTVFTNSTVIYADGATLNAACWADPLSREERRILAAALASACKRSWDAATPPLVNARACRPADALSLGGALVQISAEMSDLHLDVTERAEVAR